MKVTGTIASRPTDRVVMTGLKKDHPKRVREVALVDEDGGVISIQAWSEPDDASDPFAGLGVGETTTFAIVNPTTYRGSTRASLAKDA